MADEGIDLLYAVIRLFAMRSLAISISSHFTTELFLFVFDQHLALNDTMLLLFHCFVTATLEPI
jgi:hypothetical protein